MYAAAHHVRSPRGLVGVNCFLHHHGRGEVEGIGRSINFDLITQQDLGELVAVEYEVAPGGNSVLAYLDVVCPDGTNIDAIRSALHHAGAALDTDQRPLRRRYSPKIGVQFSAVVGLDREGELREYEMLTEHLLRLLVQRPPLPWEAHEPLIVEAVSATDGAVTFKLSADSKSRVTGATTFPLPVGAISASADTIDAFETFHGDLLRTILPTLVGLTLEEIARIGGVRVIKTPGGRVLWEWPRRAPSQPSLKTAK